MSKNKLTAFDLGPLPVEKLNNVLGLELEAGHVKFSANAQKHASRRHPDDYARCLPFAGYVVSSALYAGDDIKNPNKIELISRIPVLGSGLLVAVEIIPDNNGHYNVVSMYPIKLKTIEARRRKNHLFVL